MKKRWVPAIVLALAALGIAGYALGANAGVSLTSTGPEPANVTVNWGETVTYSNRDGAEHVIAIPRLAYTSPAVPPGGSLEYAFTGRSGNFRFVQRGKQNFAGQVQVTTNGSVTMKASPEIVAFGKSVVLSGRSTFPGSPVIVSAREAGAGGALTPVLETNAATDGSYSGRIRPQRGGRYQARVAAAQIASDTVTIVVRPRVTMTVSRRVAPAGTTIAVGGVVTPSRAADRADLAAFNVDRKRWVTIQTRPIPPSGKLRFRPEVGEGRTRIRIQVRRSEAGFASADSRIVSVVGTKSK